MEILHFMENSCGFLLSWPWPPKLEVFLNLSHFEFLSFVFYSFCFISSQVQSPKTFLFFLYAFDYNSFYIFQHLSLNLEILMPKLVVIFSLILNHLGLQSQIIEIFFSPLNSSVKKHFSEQSRLRLRTSFKSRMVVTLCFGIKYRARIISLSWAWTERIQPMEILYQYKIRSLIILIMRGRVMSLDSSHGIFHPFGLGDVGMWLFLPGSAGLQMEKYLEVRFQCLSLCFISPFRTPHSSQIFLRLTGSWKKKRGKKRSFLRITTGATEAWGEMIRKKGKKPLFPLSGCPRESSQPCQQNPKAKE